METRGGDGGAEGSMLSAEWREQSWQDRTGGVRNDGASGGSCSSRQKVDEFNVVAVWKYEEATEKPREYVAVRNGGNRVDRTW